MLLTITISVSILVVVNLLLLKFSVNSTSKQNKVDKKPVVLRPRLTIENETERLAPTGS